MTQATTNGSVREFRIDAGGGAIDGRAGESARSKGDQARDRGAWEDAAAHYQDHLSGTPSDVAIWVQLGHALKESRHLDDAEDAYRTAMRLDPEDADVALQTAHLMKILGRPREAIELYERSLKLQPTSAAHRELVGLGLGARADKLLDRRSASDAPPIVYLQVNDLLEFFRHHSTPSGIQRVHLGFIHHVLSRAETAEEQGVAFVFSHPGDDKLWSLAPDLLRKLANYIDASIVEPDRLRALVAELQSHGRLVTPKPSDSFIIVGAFWGVAGTPQLMARLREQGVFLGIYVYDLIPITWPEYTVRELTAAFTTDLCEALQLADFALAISEYSAKELRDFIKAHDFKSIPVEAVPLAHHQVTDAWSKLALEAEQDLDWSGSIETLEGEDFVLCVCTIEPRKNHRYLFDVWKALKLEGLAVPKLVIVGRRGWLVEDFMAQLGNSNYLDGSITVFHELSDGEVSTLYRACRFTVFPSLVEGWGLPLGESLAYGKLCIASNTTSLPEVGGDFVAYVDPTNLRSGIDTIRMFLERPEEVRRYEARIKAEFRPRTWGDVATDFLSATRRLNARRSTGTAEVVCGTLRSGEVLKVGEFARGIKVLPMSAFIDLKRLIFEQSFYEAEAFGAWMRGQVGRILFRCDLAPGTPAIIFLQLLAATVAVTVEVKAGGMRPRVLDVSNTVSTIRIKASVGEGGLVDLSLRVTGTLTSDTGGARMFGVGLKTLAFVDATDAIARAEIVEQLLFEV